MPRQELYCQFCHVAFAIARFRREDEESDKGWDYQGISEGSFYHDSYHFHDEDCDPDQGCETHDWEDDGMEHIAGRDCQSKRGYSGWNISAAEMKDCRKVQCLVSKDEEWMKEGDDQSFELTSDFFLSGLGDGSPEDELEELEISGYPRHDVESLCVVNRFPDRHDVDDTLQKGIPFHPWCFEIFQRISRNRLGCVDVQSLVHWWKVSWMFFSMVNHYANPLNQHSTDVSDEVGDDPTYASPDFEETSEDSDVWWSHNNGSEWLVANPLRIPIVRSSIRGFIGKAKDKEEIVKLGGFPEYGASRSPPSNPFANVPIEVRQMILLELGSRDILSLAMAAPTLSVLPQSLFRNLINSEMPWLWEISQLSIRGTDWLGLLKSMRLQQFIVKGFKNRRRIWITIEAIVEEVAAFKEEGLVPEPKDWSMASGSEASD